MAASQGPSSGLARIKDAAPAGLISLAVIAAVAGAGLLKPKEVAAPAPLAAPASVAPAPRAEVVIPGAQPSFATPEIAAGLAPSTSAPALPPDPGAAPATIQFDQSAAAAIPGQAIEIVVKFKDDAKVKPIVDAYWKNAATAKAQFNKFKSGRPEFADTTLDRVTYSNELVLVHKGGGSPAQRLATMRSAAAKMKSASDISYAEPNMIAQAGAH